MENSQPRRYEIAMRAVRETLGKLARSSPIVRGLVRIAERLRRLTRRRAGASAALRFANVKLSNPRRRVGSWAVAVREQIIAEAGPGRGQSVRPTAFFLYVPAGESRDAVYRGRLPQ